MESADSTQSNKSIRSIPSIKATIGFILLAAAALGDTHSASVNVTVDTRTGVKLEMLSIEGEQSIPAESSHDYRLKALLSYGADSSWVDVTEDATWSVKALTVLPANTAFYGNSLYAGLVEMQKILTITASYTHQASGETKTASLAVAVEPNFSVSFASEEHWVWEGDVWSVDFTPESSGPNGAATSYVWDLDGDGIFEFTSTETKVTRLRDGGSSYLIGVKAMDSQGHEAIARRYITLPKGTWAWWLQKPLQAADVLDGAFLDVAGDPYVPNPARVNNGLIIITHGIFSRGDEQWLKDMVQAIQSRLAASPPNVCIFDWKEMADPTLFRTGQATPENAMLTKADDFLTIRTYGLTQGQVLADWVKRQIALGNISTDHPIHLIGHSAGGFVMGECGTILGAPITQVTMLDTPFPVKTHFTTYTAAGGYVERYISSRFGLLCDQFSTDSDVSLNNPAGVSEIVAGRVNNISTNAHYSRSEIIAHNDLRMSTDQHANGHEWYQISTITGNDNNGFYYSPLLNNGFHGASAQQLSAAKAAARAVLAEAIPDELITGFSVFGTVTEINGLYALTEAEDAGLAKQMAMPIGAQSLKFRFQFTSPGDGDFLAVYWGTNNPVLYIGLDLPLSRDAFLEADVPVAQFAGQTNQLLFVLTSRGETNAVLELKDIVLTLSDDPDYDGLTTSEETALETDPLNADTDGDGLSDFDEVRTHLTDPLFTDSDEDGMSDSSEIQAGSDPNDPASCFAVSLTPLPSGGVRLTWQGKSGRHYRVNRCDRLGTGAYSTLATGVSGVEPQTTYEDTQGSSCAFYWVEQEQN
jgi:hypothetical protein